MTLLGFWQNIKLSSRDIKYYADKVHKAGGWLLVDATFGPPPLQYPFKWGADIVMHSGAFREHIISHLVLIGIQEPSTSAATRISCAVSS